MRMEYTLKDKVVWCGSPVGPASFSEVTALGRITYHEGGFKRLPLAITAASLQQLKLTLALAAGLSAADGRGLPVAPVATA